MPADDATRRALLDRLEPLVGVWRTDVTGSAIGEMTAEWALGREYLILNSTTARPEFPDALSIIAVDDAGEGFTHHYFDSRGVVRIYEMTFDGTRWEMLREQPDFSPLGFSQRFVGTLAEDGSRIDGAWEKTPPAGGEFAKDFDLAYVRQG